MSSDVVDYMQAQEMLLRQVLAASASTDASPSLSFISGNDASLFSSSQMSTRRHTPLLIATMAIKHDPEPVRAGADDNRQWPRTPLVFGLSRRRNTLPFHFVTGTALHLDINGFDTTSFTAVPPPHDSYSLDEWAYSWITNVGQRAVEEVTFNVNDRIVEAFDSYSLDIVSESGARGSHYDDGELRGDLGLTVGAEFSAQQGLWSNTRRQMIVDLPFSFTYDTDTPDERGRMSAFPMLVLNDKQSVDVKVRFRTFNELAYIANNNFFNAAVLAEEFATFAPNLIGGEFIGANLLVQGVLVSDAEVQAWNSALSAHGYRCAYQHITMLAQQETGEDVSQTRMEDIVVESDRGNPISELMFIARVDSIHGIRYADQVGGAPSEFAQASFFGGHILARPIFNNLTLYFGNNVLFSGPPEYWRHYSALAARRRRLSSKYREVVGATSGNFLFIQPLQAHVYTYNFATRSSGYGAGNYDGMGAAAMPSSGSQKLVLRGTMNPILSIQRGRILQRLYGRCWATYTVDTAGNFAANIVPSNYKESFLPSNAFPFAGY